jgi:CDP-glucose 4,6-dehydratase
LIKDQYFKDKRILITGNTGFKGAWLSLYLHHLEAIIYGISSKPVPQDSNTMYRTCKIDAFTHQFQADINDYEAIKSIIEEVRPNIIFHLAAQAITITAYTDPLSTFSTNMIGTAHVLEAVRTIGAPCNVVIISSDKCYRNNEWIWGYRENDEVAGLDPYSASKSVTEIVTRSYYESFFKLNNRIKIASCRSGNVMGGGDWNSNRIVPDCIKAWMDKQPITIRNPKSVRAWNYVLDILTGYLATAYHLDRSEINGEAFNLGPKMEGEIAVKDLVDTLWKFWKADSFEPYIISEDDTAYFEHRHMKLNSEKANYLLNWHSLTNVKNGLKETLLWYKEFIENPNNIEQYSKTQISEYVAQLESQSKKEMVENINCCRVCKSDKLNPIHNFNEIPLADKLTDSKEEKVLSANLSVAFCSNCYHFQIIENVDPSILFKYDYPYYSSKIPEVANHFKNTYKRIIQKKHIADTDFVMELAANDGTLIKHFKAQTKHLISVEPSLDHTKITEELGIITEPVFFNSKVASDLLKKYPQRMALIMGNNVLAHVPDPYDFAKGISFLLKEDGWAVIEVPHTLPLIQNSTFDVIFHQHYSYFNLHALIYLFNSVGLHINSLDQIDTQGGSLRLFISRTSGEDETVKAILAEEVNAGILKLSTYEQFSRNIENSKIKLLELLKSLKAEGKTIVGYGASGKATTYLNYYGIDTTYLDYIADISDNKHFKYFPNTQLQILPLTELENHPPDYILILVWNYGESIMKSLEHLKRKGTKFIVPHPNIQIYE